MAWLAVCALLVTACEPDLQKPSEPESDQSQRPSLRLATFNVAMGFASAGELTQALQQRNHPKLLQLAEILQWVRPDVILLNEFDYDPAANAAANEFDYDPAALNAALLLNDNYLSRGQNGQKPIEFAHHFRAPVNAGVDSGLDLDANGSSGEPADAWGYGQFPGQHGMLVLSRFPINAERTRTFQQFRWAHLPAAHMPVNTDGSRFYSDKIWQKLRLSSKSHWDVQIQVNSQRLHLLAFHPTPPVFDGPEDRNGWRNFDEIRFWVKYLAAQPSIFLVDDAGLTGGLAPYQTFVIAGDFNVDPLDGDSVQGAVTQLLDHPRIDSDCTPSSEGGRLASEQQGGVNLQQRGDPASDTADFDDETTGNLRLDYLLPSRKLTISGCGVFWPAAGQPGAELVEVSDHRLVWLDIEL